jgi:glycosyltransferase involved in cell wall biosynthesis
MDSHRIAEVRGELVPEGQPENEWSQTTVPGEAAVAKAPRVTVVIPTRNRPALVERAVRSALAQTLREIEVIVVIDGPDAGTKRALDRLQVETGDRRLRVLQLAQCVGGSEARNAGVRFARSQWIALLDDDDEWHVQKLERQWRMAESIDAAYAVVASRFIERTESGDRVLPGRMPAAGERFSDYLFTRRGWKSGEGFLQTSTWLVSRELLVRVPFTPGLKRCQDLDWLLRATALPETEVRVVPEVLAIFHHDERPERVSRTADWRFLYRWALEGRAYFSPRAFSFFIATFCVPSAAKQGAGLKSFFFLLRAFVLGGRPTGKSLLLFLFFWWAPEARRRAWRGRLDKVRLTAERRRISIPRQPASGKAIS